MVDPVGLETLEALQELRRLHTAARVARSEAIIRSRERHAIIADLVTRAPSEPRRRAAAKLHARSETRGGRAAGLGRRLDEAALLTSRWILTRSSSCATACRTVLCRSAANLNSGGARAYDGYMELAGSYLSLLGVRPDAGIDQSFVQPDCLFECLQRHGMLGHTGRAEVVGDAADCDDQRVVGKQRAGVISWPSSSRVGAMWTSPARSSPTISPKR